MDSFDIVIAANALHTAKHVDATLRQLHTVLAPSGFVVAIETTRNTALQMITFGHFQGVCHYEDQRRVSNMPFLSVAEWQHALRRVGFREARGVPAHIGGSTGWTQHVLLAQKAAG